MNDNTIDLDQIEEETLTDEVSDQALEAAAGMDQLGGTTAQTSQLYPCCCC